MSAQPIDTSCVTGGRARMVVTESRLRCRLRVAQSGASFEQDEELNFRYGSSNLLILVVTAAASLILLVLTCWHAARRLFGIRIPFTGRYTPREANSLSVDGLLEAELELAELRKKHGTEFTWKDETDWRAVRCKPIYASAWSVLEPDERLLLHQLRAGLFREPGECAGHRTHDPARVPQVVAVAQNRGSGIRRIHPHNG